MKIENGLVWAVMGHSTTINVLNSYDHGPSHWARVANNAKRLAEKTPGVDLIVVELFALFHDSMRDNEFHDPRHGMRGYHLAEKLGLRKVLTADQFVTFAKACVDHDAGEISADPTIGVCWDADRLDLPRVGITPTTEFLSTQAAKEEIS